MLTRLVLTIWGAWLGAIGVAVALETGGIRHPNPVLPAALPVLMVAAGLGLLVGAFGRLIRGPGRTGL